MCVTIYPLVQHIPLFVTSLHQAVQNRRFFRVHFHFFAKKKTRSLQLKLKCTICCIILLYKCQKYLTFSISVPPSDGVDGRGLKRIFHRCVRGPDMVMYVALENMVLICDESRSDQSDAGSNTKAKMSFDSKLKIKRRVRREKMSFVFLTNI